MKRFTAIITVLCMMLTIFGALTISGSAANWTDDWKKRNGDNITISSDGTVYFGGDGSNVGTLERSGVGTRFDLEWDMKVNYYAGTTSNGGITMVVYTGKKRVYMTFSETGIMHRVFTGDASQRSEWFNYDIGYTEHHYQLICDGDAADLYIDGYFAKTITLENNSSGANITIAVNPEMPTNSFYIKNFVVNKYNGRGMEEETTIEEKPFDLSAVDWQTNEILPVEEKYFDFDNPEDYTQDKQWVLRNSWEIKDGILQSFNTKPETLSAFGYVGFEQGMDAVFTSKIRIKEWSYMCGLSFIWAGGNGARLEFHKEYTNVFMNDNPGKRDTYLMSDIHPFADGNWHEIKLVTHEGGTKYQFFFDGKAVTDIINAYYFGNYKNNAKIYYYTYAQAEEVNTMEIDWAKYEPIANDIVVAKPMIGAEYLEGETIEFDATIKEELAEDVSAMDILIDGKKVATAEGPEFKAVIPALSAGAHELQVISGNYNSAIRTIRVRQAVLGNVEASMDASGNLYAELKLYDELPQIARVECYVDGIQKATATEAPYSFAVSNMTKASHTVETVCYNQNGMEIGAYQTAVFPEGGKDLISTNYANEISYRVDGAGGVATAEYSNGRHQVLMKHSANAVTYQTDEGEKTYPCGSGDFLIMTDGPFAEVYWNGQYAFSYQMPLTEEEKSEFGGNGLSVSDVEISVPEERSSFFAEKNLNVQNQVYRLADTSSYHLLEFIADKKDEGRIVLNDGIYRLDLILRGGKIYARTMNDDRGETYEMELTELREGENYYRIDTAAGMSNIHVNGRWANFFQNIRTVGKNTLAVDITGGDGLKYLGVSEYQDVYIFEDKFDGTAEVESEYYWMTRNDIVLDVDPGLGHMSLNGKGKTEAIAEMVAYAGNCDLEANVEIRKNTKGFWLMLNHSGDPYYSKIGYNFETGNYEIIDKTDTEVVKTVPGEWPSDKIVNLKLVIRERDYFGKDVALYVNGNEVISQTDSPTNKGRIGFVLNDGGVYVKDISYRGDARPLAYVTEGFHNSTVDLLDFGDEGFVLANTGPGFRYDVNGKNQTKVPQVSGTSEHMMVLKNGEALSVKEVVVGSNEHGQALYNEVARISTDQGTTWTDVAYLREEPWHVGGNTGNRLTQGGSGRIYFLAGVKTDENTGNSVVYYSDDNGRHWTRSKTELDGVKAGHVIQEGKVIEMANGVVRCYFRTDRGTLYYWDSFDYGETFIQEPIQCRTPFMSTTNCANVELDTVDGKTLYLCWSLDNSNLQGKIQYPRTRWSLAKSTDNGDTWEYLGTFHEMNAIQSGMAMMNLSVHATKKLIIMEAMSYEQYGGSTQSRTMMVPKENLKGSVRFEQVHLKYPTQEDTLKIVSDERLGRTIAINKADGSIIFGGVRMENGVVDGKIQAEYLADYVGASAEEGENGSVILKNGDAEVTFPAEAIAQKDGKKYISVASFCETYGLTITEEKGIQIISPNNGWTDTQLNGFRYALDFFANEL